MKKKVSSHQSSDAGSNATSCCTKRWVFSTVFCGFSTVFRSQQDPPNSPSDGNDVTPNTAPGTVQGTPGISALPRRTFRRRCYFGPQPWSGLHVLHRSRWCPHAVLWFPHAIGKRQREGVGGPPAAATPAYYRALVATSEWPDTRGPWTRQFGLYQLRAWGDTLLYARWAAKGTLAHHNRRVRRLGHGQRSFGAEVRTRQKNKNGIVSMRASRGIPV
jgi:hypothetical protein